MITPVVEFEVNPLPILSRLEDRLRKNILRKAVRRGANAVKEAVKANVPQQYGFLRKSIGVKISTKKGSLVVTGIIGPRSDYKKEVDGIIHRPVRYAQIVEFGRKEVGIRKKKVLSDHQRFFGKRVKEAPGQHVFEKSFTSRKQEYIDIVLNVIREEVEKALNNS